MLFIGLIRPFLKSTDVIIVIVSATIYDLIMAGPTFSKSLLARKMYDGRMIVGGFLGRLVTEECCIFVVLLILI